MATSYEVQGRRTERAPEGKSHDVVRLDTADDEAVAFAIAATMAADNLTVWVFETTRNQAGTRAYRLLKVVSA